MIWNVVSFKSAKFGKLRKKVTSDDGLYLPIRRRKARYPRSKNYRIVEEQLIHGVGFIEDGAFPQLFTQGQVDEFGLSLWYAFDEVAQVGQDQMDRFISECEKLSAKDVKKSRKSDIKRDFPIGSSVEVAGEMFAGVEFKVTGHSGDIIKLSGTGIASNVEINTLLFQIIPK